MSPAAGTPSTDPALPASLAWRFEAIVLDWDGTAVPERLAPPHWHQQRRRVREQLPFGGPADLADVVNPPAIDVGLDVLSKVIPLPGLHRPGEHQRPASQARRLDRAVRALDRVHPPDPQQVILLLAAQRPALNRDRIGHNVADPHARGSALSLRAADRHQVRLTSVALIEADHFPGKRPVDRVHHRSVNAIGHRQRGETRVVMHNIECPAALEGQVDLLPRTGDMI